MRISDWSSDVCSSDLPMNFVDPTGLGTALPPAPCGPADICVNGHRPVDPDLGPTLPFVFDWDIPSGLGAPNFADPPAGADGAPASPQKEDDNETDGWQCAKDVAWGAVENTVVGTVIGVFSSAAAEPDRKFSGGNSSGQRIPRGKIQRSEKRRGGKK